MRYNRIRWSKTGSGNESALVTRSDGLVFDALERLNYHADVVAELVAACKATLVYVESNAERYPGDKEAQSDLANLRAALARVDQA